MSNQPAKVRSPCHQRENNHGHHQHGDGKPIGNPFVAPEENQSAQRHDPDNQDARKCDLRGFLVLLDDVFANAWQILHQLFGWFARQVGWNRTAAAMTIKKPKLTLFNSSLFRNSAKPTSARPKAMPSTGT